jgi:hypothetical protein
MITLEQAHAAIVAGQAPSSAIGVPVNIAYWMRVRILRRSTG